MLIPQLQYLSLAMRRKDSTSKALGACFGVYLRNDFSAPIRLDLVPSLANVKHLRMRGTTPPMQATSLLALESVDIGWDECELMGPERRDDPDTQSFPRVETLRIDCCLTGFHNIMSDWTRKWYEAFRNTLTCFPAVKYLRLLNVDKHDGTMDYPTYELDVTHAVGMLAQQCPGLVSLGVQDGPWGCEGGLLMHTLTKVESLVLPEKIVMMLGADWMPPNLRRLEITDKDLGTDRKWAEDFSGLGIEVVE